MEEVKPYPVDPYYIPKKATSQPDPSTFDIVKATQFGIISRCRDLIESGECDVNDMDKENVSLLHWAAINNQMDLVRYYVAKGAVVDRLGGDLNSTPLNWATRQGHLSMVVLLISLGANPNILDAEGCACIHIAAQSGHTNIVAYLLAKGGDPNLRDKTGMTALMWSSYRIIAPNPTRLLLAWGADVNLQDARQGNTAGHIAALAGNHFALSLLDQAKIDWNKLNHKGETAYQLLTDRNMEWMGLKLKAMMRERGLERPSGLIESFVSSRAFRLKMMLLTPMLCFMGIGATLHFGLSYWIKVATLGLIFLLFRFISRRTFDSRMGIAVPFGLATGTTFFLCVTFIAVIASGVSFLTNLCFLVSITLLWYFFYRSATSDPGYVETAHESRVAAILELCERGSFNFERFCTSCLILRPARSKHCPACERCVSRFDHHCPWVFNCIGAKNHVAFICYMVFLLPSLGLFAYHTVQYWFRSPVCHAKAPTKDVIGFLTTVTSCHPWLFFCFANALIYLFWVTCLLLCQLYQMVWLNMTTNERINASRYGYAPEEPCKSRGGAAGRHGGHAHARSSPGLATNLLGAAGQGISNLKSPYDRGVLRNLRDLLGRGGYAGPEPIDWSKVYDVNQLTSKGTCQRV